MNNSFKAENVWINHLMHLQMNWFSFFFLLLGYFLSVFFTEEKVEPSEVTFIYILLYTM